MGDSFNTHCMNFLFTKTELIYQFSKFDANSQIRQIVLFI